MDDQDRADLNTSDVNDNSSARPSTEGEGVPIPSRIREAVEDVRRRAKEEVQHGRDVVQEYEDRYYGSRRGQRNRLEADGDVIQPYEPSKIKRRGYVATDVNERKWAALAHASTLLTALVGLGSGGVGVLLTMLIPLFIYFAFRKRSEFVAFHALQAFAIQLIGTIGWIAALTVGTIVFLALLVLSAILILVLVGLILVPLVALTYVLFLLATFALPIGMVIYSMIAAVETWSGHDYRYPYIAGWVDNQIRGDF
jgi:uncharacterized Tic20 family protein